VPLPRGPAGGHQVRNQGTEVARVLIVSTNALSDVAECPETGNVGLLVTESDEWEFPRRRTLHLTVDPSSKSTRLRGLAQRDTVRKPAPVGAKLPVCQKNALPATTSATTRNTTPSPSSWSESRDRVNLPLAAL
jgi:hypothetical protein